MVGEVWAKDAVKAVVRAKLEDEARDRHEARDRLEDGGVQEQHPGAGEEHQQQDGPGQQADLVSQLHLSIL